MSFPYQFIGFGSTLGVASPAVSETKNVNLPAGTQDGDLIILGMAYDATSPGSASATFPAGFTADISAACSGSSTRPGLKTATKFASGEPSFHPITMTVGGGSGHGIYFALVYRGPTVWTPSSDSTDVGSGTGTSLNTGPPGATNTVGSAPQLLTYYYLMCPNSAVTVVGSIDDAECTNRGQVSFGGGGTELVIADEPWESSSNWPARTISWSWGGGVVGRRAISCQGYPTADQALPVESTSGDAWAWSG